MQVGHSGQVQSGASFAQVPDREGCTDVTLSQDWLLPPRSAACGPVLGLREARLSPSERLPGTGLALVSLVISPQPDAPLVSQIDRDSQMQS